MKTVAQIFSVVLMFVLVSFFYQGMITREPVSLDYNIPIAKSVLSGEFLRMNTDSPYMYFPGSSHVIMAGFLLFGLPINLFGLFSWIFLFWVCKKAGEVFGLTKPLPFIFAGSVVTTTSVVRTIADQSVDKWLAAWFVLSLLLLEKPQRNWKYALILGFSLGMLVGTKFSGPLFAGALLMVYGKKLWAYLNPVQVVLAGVAITVTGLSWYIRNWILKGSPLYPANLPFFRGYPNYTQQDWMLWKIPVYYPEGLMPLVNAFISEYLIWTLAGFLILGFVIYCHKKRQRIEEKLGRVIKLAVIFGGACLLLPITPPYKIELFHIISDMRYLYALVIVLILAVFMLAEKYKKSNLLALAAAANMIPVFSFVQYNPKIFVGCMIGAMAVFLKRDYFLKVRG